jgi:homogentisate phytyltransferase/homogentisate geranylgeranyltransferase
MRKSTALARVLFLILAGSSLQHCVAFNLPRSVGVRVASYSPVGRPSNTFKTLHAKLDASATTAELGGSRSNPWSFLHVIWRFTRPHTLIGSALAIPAIHAFAAPTYSAFLSVSNLGSMLYAMLPALLMNLYITGLNQITDVEIDKVNKPDLPIAAGDLSIKNAIWVVLVALSLSLWIGVAHPVYGSQGLNVALWGSGILGTMYSLPPFRLKRHPLLAAFCIVTVRGTVINAGFFAHAKRAAFGGQFGSVLHYLVNDRACMLSSLFFGVFGIVVSYCRFADPFGIHHL